MKSLFLGGFAVAATFVAGCQLVAAPTTDANAPVKSSSVRSMKSSEFKFQSLSGQAFDASKLDGQVLLIVNTASKCGFTKQYDGLQKLHEKYEKQGLRVLGFPSNDFGGQEPGSAEDIGTFCRINYGVTFPLFAKAPVKGANKQPLFKWLTEEADAKQTGEVGWNFEKFLVGRDGRLIARWKSKVAPESPELIGEVERALSATVAPKNGA